jgi:hypothetical protein
MRRILFFAAGMVLSVNLIFSQDKEANESKYLIGFNLILPTGMAPATALTNSGKQIEKSYGLGVIIQRKVAKNINIFFDINTYNYNIFLADKGSDVQSIWTVAESATHWDEPGAPQIQYVHDLPTDVHFDMQATGFRLGGKYLFSDKKIRPWAGAAFGFYEWEANYFNEDKDKTYGSDKGYVSGLTLLGGVDFKLTKDMVITAFVDLASPVAEYSMEGLFYPQWDITDYQCHIMGTNRFGLTLSFAPKSSARKK